MERRLVTPYEGWPDHSYLEELEQEQQQPEVTSAKKYKPKSRKRNRTKSTGLSNPVSHIHFFFLRG